MGTIWPLSVWICDQPMRNNWGRANIAKSFNQNVWRIRETLRWKLQNWQRLLEDSSSSSTSPQCRPPAGSGILSSSNWQQRDSIIAETQHWANRDRQRRCVCSSNMHIFAFICPPLTLECVRWARLDHGNIQYLHCSIVFFNYDVCFTHLLLVSPD